MATIPIQMLTLDPIGRATGKGEDHQGSGLPGMGLPGLGDKPGAFANMLRGALQTGGEDALNLVSQLSLGGGFLSQMTGEEAGELSEFGDMSQLMDSLSGASAKQGGQDMMGLLGGGMPAIPGGVDLGRLTELLRTGGASGIAGIVPETVSSSVAAPVAEAAASAPAGHVPGAQDVAAPKAAAPEAQSISAAPASGIAAPAAPSRTLEAARAALAHRAYGRSGAAADPLGALSARYESGGEPGAVGYDRVGGTSYGIYQISSKAGTFDNFLAFLDKQAPDMAARLHAAGKADTGSAAGPMPSAWRTLAHERPGRFADLQHQFIRETHFLPALRKVADLTGVDLTGRHQAIAQVLWSTAVQHGASGSARIFARALEAVGGAGAQGFDKELIQAVYADRSSQFGSSTQRVQGSVASRFKSEMRAALSLLDGGGVSGLFDSDV